MKKQFPKFFVAWAALVAVFNVLAFVSVGWDGVEKYTDSFWIGYALITLEFIGHLICGGIALNAKDSQKMFYRLELIRTSYATLIGTFVVGGLFMLIPTLPAWLVIIIGAILLAMHIISLMKATAAVSAVEQVDQKVKAQTLFIKSLTVDAERVLARAKSEEAKAICKKVYEAVRYSDPMSNAALAGVESQITIKFSAFLDAVLADDISAISNAANEIMILIQDRNAKCKILK
ncbi:MAG: hypothetical protein E7439_06810 [Ruminococcaceae bacterium]|nr:hypothetical protein [Oscillospiraceae bacterium]